MIKITRISDEKKHLVTLELSNGEELVLDSDFAAECFLSEGDTINEDEAEELLINSERRRAVKRGYYYLSFSDYSSGEMRTKLKTARFSDDAADFAVEKITAAGYIDDERYASHLAERYLSGGNSRREAVYKICQKQIAKETAQNAVDALGFDDEAQIARLIQKKYAEKLNSKENYQKVFAALMRKGFSCEDIKRVLNMGDYDAL